MRADARKRHEEAVTEIEHAAVAIASVTALPPRPRIEPLIGMVGRKRSGKDSVAATLVEEYAFTRYAFADPLRTAALGLDPIVGGNSTMDRDYGYGGELVECAGEPEFERLSEIVARGGWERAKEIPEVRRTLQNYGVAIREIDPTFWIRATMGRALADSGPVVVTDVRFPNEAEAIRNAGGRIIRVTRPGLDTTDTHVSETALDDFVADAEIDNSGTLDDLAVAVRALF